MVVHHSFGAFPDLFRFVYNFSAAPNASNSRSVLALSRSRARAIASPVRASAVRFSFSPNGVVCLFSRNVCLPLPLCVWCAVGT